MRRTGAPRRLHRLAQEWFAERPESWGPVESLYHRLQADRGKTPPLNPELAAQFDPQMIAELEPPARDAVAWARGESSSYGREAPAPAPGAGVDQRAVADLQLAIERADWIEGSYLYNRAFENVYVDPASPAADAARTVLWRVGRWVEARASLRERDLASEGDGDLLALPPATAIARAEMRAEFDAPGFRRRLKADGELLQALERLVAQDSKGQAAGSALTFVLQAVPATALDVRLAGRSRRGGLCLVGPGRFDRSAGPGRGGRRRRLGDAFADSEAAAEASDARALAVLSPHGDLPRLLVQSERSGDLYAYANHLAMALDEAEWPECPSGPFSLESVSDAGLAAEWLTMAALALRDRNLTLVGRRAEAWRQTVAGRWRYGPRLSSGVGRRCWMR